VRYQLEIPAPRFSITDGANLEGIILRDWHEVRPRSTRRVLWDGSGAVLRICCARNGNLSSSLHNRRARLSSALLIRAGRQACLKA